MIVAGRYRLDRLLGQGGMGIVWAATHTVTRRAVAMKFIRGAAHQQPELRRRFLREAHAAAAVRHPNVVEILDLFEVDADTPVMVMDLLQGETLGQCLTREEKLTLPETARLVLPAVSALGAAHARGVVHRDLKPDNIYLARSDTGIVTKVLDFGIAKLAHGERTGDASIVTQTGSTLGTPSYMSPEQAAGEKDVDHRADVWALGVILYECLSGMRPIEGDSVGQVIMRLMTTGITPLESVTRGLPEDVTSLVGRMLTRERSRRPQDLREVQRVLGQYTDVATLEFGLPKSEIPTDFGEDLARQINHAESSRSSEPPLKANSAEAVDTNGPHAVPSRVRKRSTRVAVMFAAALLASIGLVWRLVANTARPPQEASAAATNAARASSPTPTPGAKSQRSAMASNRNQPDGPGQILPVATPVDAGRLPSLLATAESAAAVRRQVRKSSKRSAEASVGLLASANPRVSEPAASSRAPTTMESASAPAPASPRRGGIVDKAPF